MQLHEEVQSSCRGTNEVDAALAASAADVGARVLALVEDQWFDRKIAAIAPKDLAVALVAFANAEGAIVVVGASNGQVRGLAGHRKKINELRLRRGDVAAGVGRAARGRHDR